MKYISNLLVIFFLIFLYPFEAQSAEILQINTSNNILVGDQNRNLEIKLFCVEIENKNEQKAISLLKREFPRGRKVKIKPLGFSEGILTAEVFDIYSGKEMSETLRSQNLLNKECLS